MVLTDITALKRLEQQIRRSDRLASLGTLSAGMAHEIKNPLVSIKTFAQLLPERYQDSDFRQTFSNLIGHEIDRIDSLVNQLLRFARPAKPLLKPMHVHEVLEKSLLLVGHRLYQKDIKLTRSWEADVDTIRADADQLEQVFLNFFLNAMDAMKNGGELNVSTEIRTDAEWVSPADPDRMGIHVKSCGSPFVTMGKGSRPKTLPMSSIRFSQPRTTGRVWGCRSCMGSFRNMAGRSKSKANFTREPPFTSFSRWSASTERWRRHDGTPRSASFTHRMPISLRRVKAFLRAITQVRHVQEAGSSGTRPASVRSCSPRCRSAGQGEPAI